MKLTLKTKWELFRGMAARKLMKNGFNGDAYEMTECLDMSFHEDYKDADIDDWEDMMDCDIEDFKDDAPELFARIH